MTIHVKHNFLETLVDPLLYEHALCEFIETTPVDKGGLTDCAFFIPQSNFSREQYYITNDSKSCCKTQTIY
jgi:hypothetical protein